MKMSEIGMILTKNFFVNQLSARKTNFGNGFFCRKFGRGVKSYSFEAIFLIK